MGRLRTVNVDIQTVAIMNAAEERSFNPHGGRLFCRITLEVKHALILLKLRIKRLSTIIVYQLKRNNND